MKVQNLKRTRLTFMEKMTPKDIAKCNVTINNFENFCMEKCGKADFISELKDHDSDGIFDIFRSWINWNGKLAPSSMKVMFSRIKKYFYLRGKIKLHLQDIKRRLSQLCMLKNRPWYV